MEFGGSDVHNNHGSSPCGSRCIPHGSYSSRNLADWKFENTVIRMKGKFADMGWAGRPALLHCKATGKYIIVFEADSPRQWKRHKVGFAVCDRIDGKYEWADARSPEGARSTGGMQHNARHRASARDRSANHATPPQKSRSRISTVRLHNSRP